MTTLSASSLFSVQGLVAVITGAGSGLGAMAARALDANGAKAVYILGRRREALERTAASGLNGSIQPIVADVGSQESLAAAAKQIEEEVGYVNVVFANAGTSGIGRWPRLKPHYSVRDVVEMFFRDVPMQDFTETLHVNITGAFYTALAFLELLDRGNGVGNVPQKSQVVITNSASSFARSPVTGFDYSASKAGVMHLMKVMQTAFKPFKIRVNCIAPGFFATEMSADHPILDGVEDGTVDGSIPTDMIPLGRMGGEKDFAGVTLYLMSEAGAFVNGSVLLMDGGRLGIVPSAY